MKFVKQQLELLWQERPLFLNAFSPEVKRCLDQQIFEKEERDAYKIQTTWDRYKLPYQDTHEKINTYKVSSKPCCKQI